MINNYKLPQGTSDYLPDECAAVKDIEDKLLARFKSYGFRRIDTPTMEYYELYAGSGKTDLNSLFKVTDCDGGLLILRPDMTLPISRIVATKLPSGLRKLCYTGKVFSMRAQDGRLREFEQAGVELTGSDDLNADAEAIALAVYSLLDCGLKDFMIDVGHIGFFKGMLASLNLSDADADELMDCVERKDTLGEEILARRVGLPPKDFERVLKLPMLFGGAEILDEAEALCSNVEMRDAVASLKALYAKLTALGCDKYVSFDLAVVGEMKYYSGIVFKGLTKYFGRPFLSGGRYDTLCDAFGVRVPAVGFAFYINYLLLALGAQGETHFGSDAPDVVVGFTQESYAAGFDAVARLAAEGMVCFNAYTVTREGLAAVKETSGAQRAIFIRDGVAEEI